MDACYGTSHALGATIVIAVFSFWIASTTWLVIREIVPLYRAGEPPAFTIDITAEAGGSRSSWTIKFNGQNVGSGFSGVKPRPDRTFDLFSEWHFVNFRPLNIGEIKKIKGWYRVDKDGNLKELQAELGVVLGRDEWLGEAKGVVKDDLLMMSRQVSVGGVPVDLSRLSTQAHRGACPWQYSQQHALTRPDPRTASRTNLGSAAARPAQSRPAQQDDLALLDRPGPSRPTRLARPERPLLSNRLCRAGKNPDRTPGYGWKTTWSFSKRRATRRWN